MRYVLALLLIASCQAAWADDKKRPLGGLLVGAGTLSCAKFGQAYKLNPETFEAIYFAWAQGYLSRDNLQRTVDDGNFVDLLSPTYPTNDQKAYIRRFCDQNPLKSYFDAVIALHNHMAGIPGLMQKAPKGNR